MARLLLECSVRQGCQQSSIRVLAPEDTTVTTDPVKAEKFAPKTAPHAFETKRISLEQDYYEQFNKDHVDIINMNTDDIETFTSSDIRERAASTSSMSYASLLVLIR